MENYPNTAIDVSSIYENSENNNQAQQNTLVPYEPEVLSTDESMIAKNSPIQPQTQAVQQQFSVANASVIPYQQSAPHYLGNITSADINLKQAQDLNYQRSLSWIRVNEYYEKKTIDLQFEVERQKILAGSFSRLPPQMKPDGTITGQHTMLDRNTAIEFLKIYEAIRLDRTYGSASNFIWIRDKSLMRHIIESEAEFCMQFEDYIFEQFPAYEEISPTTIQRLKRMLLHLIPRLSVSGLEVIEENCVVFPNGTFDLISGIFHKRNMVGLFNRFSLLYDFRACW